MKQLLMLVLICASIFTYSQSYASGNAILPGSKSSKSTKAQTASKTHSQVRNVKKNRRQHGYNYYNYANRHAYLKYMGKAMNGR
jgi:hypothetical protein